MKRCSKCEETKPSSEFYKDRAMADGLRFWCKQCFKESVRVYKNRPSVKRRNSQRSKTKYRKNRDEILTKAKEYREKYPDRARAVRASYSESTRGRAKQLWHKIRRRHKGSKETMISCERIEQALERGVCEATGSPFVFTPSSYRRRHHLGPSVDKINSLGDYTEDNTQVVCNMYNFGKNEFTHDEFLEFCRAFVAHADGATDS